MKKFSLYFQKNCDLGNGAELWFDCQLSASCVIHAINMENTTVWNCTYSIDPCRGDKEEGLYYSRGGHGGAGLTQKMENLSFSFEFGH